MEVDDSNGALVNKSEDEKKGSSDPVVYQLVRVEGDGTLVPATEDDVLEFEHFLQDEKVDRPSIEDAGHVEEVLSNSNDCILLKKSDSEGNLYRISSSPCNFKNMHIIAQENRLQLLDDSLSPPRVVSVQQPDKFLTEQGDSNITQQDNASTETTKSIVLNDSCGAEKDKADACSRPVDDTSTEPSVSGVTGSVPDFSILRGEVCLDDLTIRELQEAFRATFGRQTSVKDKIWLKRRITMGLTNSCDVTSSGCVVKDYRIVGKDGRQDISNIGEIPKIGLQSNLVRDQGIYPGNERDSPSSSYYQSEDQQGFSKRFKRVPIHNDEPQGNLLAEPCTNKRTRKPTKRYIEELSDNETHDSIGKLSSPAKRTPHDEVSLKPRAAPFHELESLGRIYPTRKYTLGGLNVHVPYASRMRRGRPRKDFISFADKEPSVQCNGVKTAAGMMLAKECEEGNHVRKASEVLPTVNSETGHLEAIDTKVVQNLETNFYKAAFKPKIKRGLTRKHHRAWTLCEVMKLVDGVARFGAGKWSEIRKLSFSSYSYRTSVDLKDKWRNLIRATQTQLPAQKDVGVCPRKINPSIIPIPTSILLRVKELNELQSQGGGFTGPVKLSGQNSKVVKGIGSGFL
ncbi:hypothetical protein HU200_002252 [Digitaria exilis]|uniref:Uncharacterized protein n=1 Tax=Digitaria exilis TaxID=1010633 RepID=A0A835KX46_9POAL|nr:hypothetical protein HU200_002252 [Digitaria exilis]